MHLQPRLQYTAVTASYWAFTLSDGALRMLVLLHLHQTGRSPLDLLWVLLPYELAGVVTSLAGGWLGAALGLKATLLAGLVLQAMVCAALGWDALVASMPLVMATQLVSGIAKDLVKTGAKSYVKVLAPDGTHGALFRLVALLTGSKNALKGIGFFVGGLLLGSVGFAGSVHALALVLAVATVLAATVLAPEVRSTRPRPGLAALFAHEPWLNWLAAARLFLFGSREVWFAIGLPLFLVSDVGWTRAGVGAFLAAWVVGYGIVQALAPRIVRPADPSAGGRAVALWTGLALVPLVLAALLLPTGMPPGPVLAVALGVHGVLFAVDSSLHSWLVVARGGEPVSLRVGFYYAANAAGRVTGLGASAVLFASAGGGLPGMVACLGGGAVALALATLCSLPLGWGPGRSAPQASGPRTGQDSAGTV